MSHEQIPTPWKQVPLGRLFKRQNRPPAPGAGVVTAFRDGKVMLRSRRRLEGFTEAIQEIGYQGIRKDDLVIHAMDGFAGAIGVSEDDGKSSPVYSALTPRVSASPRFYAYVLRNYAVTGLIQSLAQGIRERSTDFRWSTAKSVSVPVPSSDVQQQIADYLDHETAEIDAFIANLRDLIQLSMERAKKVADENLTQGIARENSIRTLLGRIIRINEGQVDPRLPQYQDMALIAPNHIQSRSGQIIGLESAVQQGAESGKYLATKGQVLYSKIRPALMKAAIAPVSCLCSADMYAIDGEEEWVSNAYLLEYLLSPEFENYAVTMSDRVAMPKLNRDTLNAAPISLPPLRLQGDIAARNQRNRSDVDNLVTEIETLIQLALERRAALITAVVTGQIDVTAKHKPAAEQLEDDVAQGLHREYA